MIRFVIMGGLPRRLRLRTQSCTCSTLLSFSTCRRGIPPILTKRRWGWVTDVADFDVVARSFTRVNSRRPKSYRHHIPPILTKRPPFRTILSFSTCRRGIPPILTKRRRG